MHAAAIADTLRPIAEQIEPFVVTGFRREQFGAHHEVAVTTVLPIEHVLTIHLILSDAVEGLGAAPLEPRYHRQGFAAHATDSETGSLAIGERCRVDCLTLVDMRAELPGADPMAATTFRLGRSGRTVTEE